MKRTLIKIIRRKDLQANTDAATRDRSQELIAASVIVEPVERGSSRKIEDTVAMWINERRESKRAEDLSAFSKLFGQERLSGETA